MATALARADFKRSRRIRTLTASRLAAALLLIGGSVALAVFHQQVRSAEAFLGGQALKLVTSYDLYSWMDQLILTQADGSHLALRVTPECSVLVVLVPTLLALAVILTITRVPFSRWLLSLVAVATVMSIANVIRIVTIAIGAFSFGNLGYDITHTVVGTLIIAAGSVGGVILMLFIQRKPRAERDE